jgi:hypothetical protein
VGRFGGFLESARQQGRGDILGAAHAAVHAPVQLAARHQPVRRHLPLARPPDAAGAALAKMRDPQFPRAAALGSDNPNTDGSKGSTLPPPPLHTVFVDVCRSTRARSARA